MTISNMCHTGCCHWYVINKKTSQFEIPKANICVPWKMELAVHYGIWAHQLLLAVIVTKYRTGRNSSNISIHMKNESELWFCGRQKYSNNVTSCLALFRQHQVGCSQSKIPTLACSTEIILSDIRMRNSFQ